MAMVASEQQIVLDMFAVDTIISMHCETLQTH